MLATGPIAYILLFLLTTTSHARNTHRHRELHRQYARQRASQITTFWANPTSVAEGISSDEKAVAADGNAIIDDIQEVETGLEHLPKDFLKFLNAVEGLESLLGSLLSVSSGDQSTRITPMTTSMARTAGTQDQVTTTIVQSQETSIVCYAPGPTGGPVPCNSISHPTMTTQSMQTSSAPALSICYAPGPNGGPTPCSSISTITTTPTVDASTIARSAPYPLSNHTMSGYEHSSASRYTGGVMTMKSSSDQQARTMPPSATSSRSSSSTMYTFNPQATDNVAVYYGQTSGTTTKGLLSLCQDVNVDIVILAFVYDFFGPSGYPSAEFGPSCWASPFPQAPNLANCSSLAPEIASCQRIGKKVLVSVGGAVGNSTLGSASQARAFAKMLWNLFGAGTNDTAMRPFGSSVVVDGFDIDNENHDPAHYHTLATALRHNFAQDVSKTYYLSAAPQCPMPDASIPTGLMYEADFIWVQFYNNPFCNLGSSGFPSSFREWSQNLAVGSGNTGRPRLYIGAPAASFAAGSGYIAGSNLSTVVDQALRLNVGNMGGMMLWDGTDAMMNVDGSTGANYLQYAKSALQL